MADVTSMREEDWGPWQKELPPVGSTFLLRLTPRHAEPQLRSRQFRYRLMSIDQSTKELRLQRWDGGGGWEIGHRWNMAEGPQFRALKEGNVAVQPPPVATGCTCGRCGAFNPYAAPNRPNGAYLCYECRT